MSKLSINKDSLILMCIWALMGSRIICAFGAPSILNFLHFGFLIILITLDVIKGNLLLNTFTLSLMGLIIIILISAILNLIAPVNTLLTILILIEPFILISGSSRWQNSLFVKTENALIFFSLLNLIISYYQYFILKLIDDDVRGIFLKMSSGAHLNGAFAIVMSIYFIHVGFMTNSLKCKVKSVIIAFLQLAIVVMCDNKQSILGYGIGLMLLVFANVKNVKVFLKTVGLFILGILFVYLLTFSVFSKILTWVDNPEYMLMGIKLKFSFIEILKIFRNNPIQLLIGFGPGMTLSRVARLLPEYKSLSFLGVTYSEISEYFKFLYSQSWLMQASSLWMYYFSYASFYGDFGLLGLGAMINAYRNTFNKFCKTNLTKYLFWVVLAHGFLFDWLEEPSFMVTYFITIILLEHKWAKKSNRIINTILNM